jgi:spermidine synthase
MESDRVGIGMRNGKSVIPWEELGRAIAPGGGKMSLWRRGNEFLIRVDGAELMSSRQHSSEEYLAELACEDLRVPRPRVLVGGLGMGFTLRAALDVLPADAHVVVAELVPEVVEWNRTILSHLAGHPLKDPRVTVAIGDVAQVMQEPPGFHSIMLDVDNGPSAMTAEANDGLYTLEGLARARKCLLKGGILAVWSTEQDRFFELRLSQAGFERETVSARACGRKGTPRHTLFLGRPR